MISLQMLLMPVIIILKGKDLEEIQVVVKQLLLLLILLLLLFYCLYLAGAVSSWMVFLILFFSNWGVTGVTGTSTDAAAANADAPSFFLVTLLPINPILLLVLLL
jgi:hypothetical protein